ncbi:MFS transporter [Myceligenerans indicum]|uniref:MFS transporter n=1 Tax=Myceligenerans indicum TaxID=2593663 RepID=A0ABS1LLU9_9MICO|nr:MFS transporter [Myceligenerans indicum]MBL0887204.1 MFS transporter [Myceligenerans indicum]
MTQTGTPAPATRPDPPRRPDRRYRTSPRVHPAWWVALVSFLTILGAAAFAAAPGLLVDPLHADFGWSRSTIGMGLSVQLVLYGITAPFAAALMDRFGIRPVVATALTIIAIGAFATIWMTEPWHFVLTWGVMVGLGSGSLALAFTATVTQRWFSKRRGLVSGVLTAATASGQLVFLPLLAWLVENQGWRAASTAVALSCALVMPLVLLLLRDHPADVGLAPYGGDEFVPRPPARRGVALRTLTALFRAARTPVFWLLAGAFAICGATTNGLVRTHFVPSAHDHGMPVTVAASLLAVIGVVDVVGTVGSGWLTDRFSPRALLGVYYTLRGVALLFLPALMAPQVEPPMVLFIVFYGLDWVATVPPTLALCREIYGEEAPVVFGWVLASHQVGAGVVTWLGGLARDLTGSYDLVWYGAGVLCAGAALMSLLIRRVRHGDPAGA